MKRVIAVMVLVALSMLVMQIVWMIEKNRKAEEKVAESVVEIETPVELELPELPIELNDAEIAVLGVVLKYAQEFEICPALILAVIQQESEFRHWVIGDRGRSIGLMQVQFIAAKDAGYTGTRSQWRHEGIDVETNIEFGVRYLALQKQRYSSSTVTVYATETENVLSAYNAGQPTLKNEWYVQQVLNGRSNNRGYFFYLSQLGIKHLTQSNSLPPQEEEDEFVAPALALAPAPAPPTTAVIRSGSRKSKAVIRSGSRKSKMVAITIDDGFNSALVAQALRILREENVKCTFFPIGKVVGNNPRLWRQVVAEGHELGNHTYSHLSLKSAKNKKQILDEIKKWEAVVENTGVSAATKFFRPPKMSGFTNARDAARYSTIIAKLGYSVVLWSIETYSSIYKNKGTGVEAAKVVDHVVNRVRGGDIILLHFIRPDISALRGIIRGIRAKGLEPVTLTTLLSR